MEQSLEINNPYEKRTLFLVKQERKVFIQTAHDTDRYEKKKQSDINHQ